MDADLMEAMDFVFDEVKNPKLVHGGVVVIEDTLQGHLIGVIVLGDEAHPLCRPKLPAVHSLKTPPKNRAKSSSLTLVLQAVQNNQ